MPIFTPGQMLAPSRQNVPSSAPSLETWRTVPAPPYATCKQNILPHSLGHYIPHLSLLRSFYLTRSSRHALSLLQCEELDRLINIDRESAAFENEMLDIADGKEAKDLTATRDKLNKQVERLKKKKQDKGC